MQKNGIALTKPPFPFPDGKQLSAAFHPIFRKKGNGGRIITGVDAEIFIFHGRKKPKLRFRKMRIRENHRS